MKKITKWLKLTKITENIFFLDFSIFFQQYTKIKGQHLGYERDQLFHNTI
jgi:hypothetical protein